MRAALRRTLIGEDLVHRADTVSSLLIGRMLARRAPGRELAACVVFAILVSVYDLVPMLGNNGGFPAVLCMLIVLSAAAWGRHRRLGGTLPKPV